MSGIDRRRAVAFILLIGTVSLFADTAYEGARSVTGPFLALLGASGAAVGAIAGGGELIGYALRMASGIAADRSKRYWSFAIVGFAINLGAVPLLALAGDWRTAALLIVAERAGKALRNPARDALLSHATETTGHGWGFGLHQAMDQAGAVAGPLIVAAVLAVRGSYPAAFATLAIPAILAMTALLTAWRLFPDTGRLPMKTLVVSTREMRRTYWVAVATMSVVGAATTDYALIAFHFGKTQTLPLAWIPVAYSVAMASQGTAAFLLGRMFDRVGAIVLPGALVFAAFATLCAFSGTQALAVLGVVLWGIGMGGQESVMRALIATLVPAERRAAAFGTFNACFGIAWFAGSALMGWLYDISIPALIAFSLVGQLAAAAALAAWIGGRRAAGTL